MTRVCPSVCLSTGGVPHLARWGEGTPARSSLGGVPNLARGYPSQVQVGERGYPSQVQLGGGYPGQVQSGVPKMGYPLARSRWGDLRWSTPSRNGVLPQPGQDGGYPRWGIPPPAEMGYPPTPPPPPRDRTADGVLDTPWLVCLLRSRRRTFLLKSIVSRFLTSLLKHYVPEDVFLFVK